MREFTKVPFVDATRVNPEVLELILSQPFGAEFELLVAILLFASVSANIFEENFRFRTSPSMRKNSIWRDSVVGKIHQYEFPSLVEVEKSHADIEACIFPKTSLMYTGLLEALEAAQTSVQLIQGSSSRRSWRKRDDTRIIAEPSGARGPAPIITHALRIVPCGTYIRR
jgi:hypothetical protein